MRNENKRQLTSDRIRKMIQRTWLLAVTRKKYSIISLGGKIFRAEFRIEVTKHEYTEKLSNFE